MKPLFIFFSLINITVYGQTSYQYTTPEQREDGWVTSHLQKQRIDSLMIDQLFNQLKNEEHQIHSILIVKNGELVIEEYFGGHNISTQHDLRSATKSVISLLMGIAIEKGLIASIDDPISKHIKKPVAKKNLSNLKEQITIRHLLTMSSGWDCDDWEKQSKGQEDKVYKKKDWLQYTLDLPMTNEPGAVAAYCTMGVMIAAEIISQAAGMPIDQFAMQYLFQPLGIVNISWGHTATKEVIPSGKRLYMTSRDMAKIGQLVVNKGQWNQVTIVSEKWIEESHISHAKIAGLDYGFLWWKIPFKIGGEKVLLPTAMGNGGQYVFTYQEANLVVVFTGGAYNSQKDKVPFVIMQEVFLPLFLTH